MLSHYADMRRRQSIAAAGAAPGAMPGTPITTPNTPAPTDTAAPETKGKAAAKATKKEKAAGGGGGNRKRANAADAVAGEANGPAKKKPRKAPAKKGKGKDKDKVDGGRRYTPQDVTATLLELHKALMAHDRSAQLFNVPVDTVLYNIPVWTISVTSPLQCVSTDYMAVCHTYRNTMISSRSPWTLVPYLPSWRTTSTTTTTSTSMTCASSARTLGPLTRRAPMCTSLRLKWPNIPSLVCSSGCNACRTCHGYVTQARHVVIGAKMIELGYCCGGEPRQFLPVPLGCAGPRCGGLISRDADFSEVIIPPKEYVCEVKVYARLLRTKTCTQVYVQTV